MAQCGALTFTADSAASQTLPMEGTETASDETGPLEEEKQPKSQQQCPHCQCAMQCILTDSRPKWREFRQSAGKK